ncbi:MAG: hypothetical protein JWN46_1669 [Acidimicrobiales bacterium]|nr:hypothetical protein [Acidimicrobiales bacterium]
MPENTSPKTDTVGADHKQGPNPSPGGKVDVEDRDIPPYDDRTTSRRDDKSGRAEAVERQLAETKDVNVGATASPAEESPVQEHEVTDDAPDSPHGVGESPSRSGEDLKDKDGKEAGREDAGAHPDSGRPTGTSDKRDITGVG